MITRKIRRPKKEKITGMNLRLSDDEFEFLHEVKYKRGCTIAAYLRFLLHRATYEASRVTNESEEIMTAVSLLMNQQLLKNHYRMNWKKSERDELERIKVETGVPCNTFIRWLLRRRMKEYQDFDGELMEIV